MHLRRILWLAAALSITTYLLAGPEPDPWKAAIAEADQAANRKPPGDILQPLLRALSFSEGFSDSDPRTFETLVRLLTACPDSEECEQKPLEVYFDRALRIRSKSGRSDARQAELLMDLGQAASYRDKYRDALLCYGEALDIRKRVFGDDSEAVAKTYAAMAWIYLWQQDKSQAERTIKYAIELREKAGAVETVDFASLLEDSAALTSNLGQEKEAETQYQRAIELQRRFWGERDARFIRALRTAARTCQGHENSLFSERIYLRIVELQLLTSSPRGEDYFRAVMDLGRFYLARNRLGDAETSYLKAAATRAYKGENDLLAAEAWEQLAQVRLKRHDPAGALDTARRSLAARQALLPETDYRVLSSQALLAELFAENGNTGDSEAAFEAFANGARVQSPYQLMAAAERLSEIYEKRRDLARAAAKLELAIATSESLSGSDTPELGNKMLRLGRLYQQMGRVEDANRVNIRATQIAWAQFMKGARTGKGATVIWAAVGILAGAAVIAGLVSIPAYLLLRRRLDKRLTAFFEVRAEEPAAADTGQAAETVMERPAPVLPVRTIALHADGGTLFSIRVINLLLSVATLGIYAFWGKAKVRRYLCSQGEFDQDRFAFHGTGRELLFGWLKGLPFLAFIIFFPNLLPIFWQKPNAVVAGQMLAFAAILVLWPVARAGAYRYRMNRMSWRGIRFSFRGSTMRFLLINLAGYALTVLTLGIYHVFLQNRVRHYFFNQTWFGNTRTQYSGRGRDLLPVYIFAVPLIFLSLGLFWPWWSAMRSRYYWAHTTFAGMRMRCTATGGRLLWLWTGNFLLIVPTLGLGIAWATVRSLQFWTRHIELTGEPDLAAVRQESQAVSAMGESFADFLGFDFGF